VQWLAAAAVSILFFTLTVTLIPKEDRQIAKTQEKPNKLDGLMVLELQFLLPLLLCRFTTFFSLCNNYQQRKKHAVSSGLQTSSTVCFHTAYRCQSNWHWTSTTHPAIALTVCALVAAVFIAELNVQFD
jgi:hypothetical protein